MDPINVAFVTNERFFKYTYVAVFSLVMHINPQRHYMIYVVSEDITDLEKSGLYSISADHPNLTFCFIDPEPYIEGYDFYVLGHFSKETYYRLALQEMLPDLDKILYLDSDIIVKADVADLYDTDIAGKMVGACMDPDTAGLYNGYKPDKKKYMDTVLALRNPYSYFQAGVLLMNLSEFRKSFSLKEILDYATARRFQLLDQDVLNHFCEGRVEYCDMSWNLLVDFDGIRRSDIVSKAPARLVEEYDKAREKPFIIHYAGPQKPWNEPAMDYGDEFWDVARQTCYCKSLLYGVDLHVDKEIDNWLAEKHELIMADVPKVKKTNKKIAVHLHLYYEDLLDEFCAYLKKIPFGFDLFISCREIADKNKIRKKTKSIRKLKRLVIRCAPNRGRDIAPFYVLFADELRRYDLLLHIHSKKSLYQGSEQSNWRRMMLESVLGSRALVERIVYLMEHKKPGIGLFFPETEGFSLIAKSWLQNEKMGRQLISEMGCDFDDDLFDYPIGSFFWAKVDAIMPLFDKGFRYDDFPDEAGQIDGTLAHVLERAVSFVCRSRGYALAIGDIHDNMIRIGRSYKLYKPYFASDYEDVIHKLKKYNIVSFDIFDTLITRKVYEPDDIFVIMQEMAEQKLGISCDYPSVRKKAEFNASKKHGAKTGIYEIYEEVADILNLKPLQCQKLMDMETDLETEFAIPRYDVISVFNELKRVGKRIILTSDMYLPVGTLKRILDKCGVSGYEAIYVSCEVGYRKDTGAMWKYLSDIYPQCKMIHVGQNMRSDVQSAAEKLIDTYYIMNPRTAFKLSEMYKNVAASIGDRSISSSIVWGKIINENLYNSPFNLKTNGQPVIEDGYTAGAVVGGALFTLFMQWLCKECEQDNYLLFLSREGFCLQKFYEAYCRGREIAPLEHQFFMTSQRAVLLASANTIEDLDGVFDQEYNGSFGNFLYEKFGIKENNKARKNEKVSLPKDRERLKEWVYRYKGQILNNARQEKDAYLRYVRENLDEDEIERAVVVELGYSGTIQYYLTRLLKHKIGGRYLCTDKKVKPSLIGCEVKSVYKYNFKYNEYSYPKGDIALLEAILEAPFGQLVRMKKEKDKVVPEYRKTTEPGNGILEMQKGIRSFAEDFGKIEKTCGLDLLINVKEAIEIFRIAVSKVFFADPLLDQLRIEDKYCIGRTIEKKSKAQRVNRKSIYRYLQDNHYKLYVFMRKIKGLCTGHGFNVVGEL